MTPSARSANLIAGDGTKNGFSAPNKKPGTNQNDYLTGKAPYKSDELSVPVASLPIASLRWRMGGVPPLGYRVANHKLVVIDSEAMRRFTVGGSGKSVARCHRTVLAYWKFVS